MRKRFSTLSISVLSALVLFLIDTLLVRDPAYLLEQSRGPRFWVNLGLSIFAVQMLLLFLFSFIKNKKQAACIAFLLTSIPQLLQANYFATFREFLSPFTFSFFFNNPTLSLQYAGENSEVLRSVGIVIADVTLIVGLYWVNYGGGLRKTIQKILLTASSVVFLGVLLVCTYAWYGVHDFQQSTIAFASALLENASRTSGVFRVSRPSIPPSEPGDNAPDVVWIIGESMVADHLGLYGYHRDTTPNLSKMAEENQVIHFTDAVSIGTKTMLSVPYMLFGLAGPDPNGKIYGYPSIFNYAKSKGYQTALFSAQDLRWYNADKLIVDESIDVFKPGPRFSPSVTVSKGAEDIDVIEKGFLPALHSATKPLFYVLQLDGSHYPYSQHSPQAFKKYLPEETPNSINAYDNTILYTDYLIAKVVREVRARNANSWILYSSDHGQNLGANRKFHMGYNQQVVKNVLLVFPPEGSVNLLRDNQNRPVSQVDLFATTLDLIRSTPVKPIDGLSLLQEIPTNRIRIVSAYMPTFENEPDAALVFPGQEMLRVDFSRGVVEQFGRKQASPLRRLNSQLLQQLERHMQ